MREQTVEETLLGRYLQGWCWGRKSGFIGPLARWLDSRPQHQPLEEAFDYVQSRRRICPELGLRRGAISLQLR